jgi:hypothetical protein
LAALVNGSSEFNSHKTLEDIHSTNGITTVNNNSDSTDSTSTCLNTFTVHSYNHNFTRDEQSVVRNLSPLHELSNDNTQSRPIENFKRKRGRPRKSPPSQESMNCSPPPPSQTNASKHNTKQYTGREDKKEQFYWNYVCI